LIAFKRTWEFPAKGLVAAPREKGGGRLKVVTAFLSNRQMWKPLIELETTPIGPRDVEGSFAHQWWEWWGGMQPKARQRCTELGLSRLEDLIAEDWEVMAETHGHNGLSLVVGSLLWWGDAAAAVDESTLIEDWRVAVKDIDWVLAECTKGVGPLYVKEVHITGAGDRD
jgi:hypothetical protein